VESEDSLRIHERAEGFLQPLCDSPKLRSVFFVKAGTNCYGGRRVDGRCVEIDVLNHAIFANHKRRAPRKFHFVCSQGERLHDPVLLQNGAVHIAQQRKSDADLLCESRISWGAVNANAENYRITCFDLSQIRLIGLELLRSTTCESENVEGEDDVLLTPKTVQ
jgi:hypothetical protein